MIRLYKVLKNYYFIIFIGFFISFIPSIISPIKVDPHYLALSLVINIIIANIIVFIFIYFIENIMKFSIILVPWLLLTSFLEFYVGISAIVRGISGGYFTILLIFLEFYGMLYFTQKKRLYLGLIYLTGLAFIEILVYNKIGM
ncbi:hypothetical protein J5U22_01872 [Saccharolobus shibatae]|uniref:Uncharacterized protein n=2 Tax=Saccharolobus shibatae TaxID=2286 RepID=A0A8F5BVV9_9CREN|nr:hypothetical protein J5U21_01939 [Saccharolobus shibatae]QXJ35325.1 hypothetical protein J5U22_01872 [Saccharolobus shibatae]